MKRISIILLVLLVGTLLVSPSAISATSNTPGSKCLKVGATAKSGKLFVTCTKSGKKLLWKAVTPPKSPAPGKTSKSPAPAGGPKIGDSCSKVGDLLPYQGHSIRCMEDGKWADW